MASLRAGILCLVLAVSVLDVAQSASITKVNSLELPGGEKITKREAPNQPPQTVAVRADSNESEKEDAKLPHPTSSSHEKVEDRSEIGRERRAAPANAEEAEDMDTAANTVFLPQFRKHFRPANRLRREVNDEAIEHIAHHAEGNGRFVRAAQNQADDLDTAANTVFLPQFRKRFRPNFRQF